MDATLVEKHKTAQSPPAPAADAAPKRPANPAASYAQLGAELGEYLSYYVAVRLDQARLATRRAIVWIGAGIALLLVAAGGVLTATALLLVGAAQLLDLALGDRPGWGNLLIGLGVLLTVVVGLAVVLPFLRHLWVNQLREKYAERRDQQRRQFGHDLTGQS